MIERNAGRIANDVLRAERDIHPTSRSGIVICVRKSLPATM
jgi:hypothetical protein